MRQWLERGAIVVVGLAVTAVVVGISFDPFLLVGASGVTTTWGPAMGKPAVMIGSILLIGAAGWTVGRVRIAMLMLWLGFVACTTHRLTERSGGRADDVWFGFAVQRLEADRDHDPVAARCQVATWVVHCIDASGKRLSSVSPLPFVQLSPGAWDHASK